MSNRGRHRNIKIKGNWIHKVLPQNTLRLMLQRQKDQGNMPNIVIFEIWPSASVCEKGFAWNHTPEGWEFWHEISQKIKSYKNNYL